MQLKAPAKLNLHLRVGPARPDGYHPLLSWMCTVGLFDEIDLEKSPTTTLECSDPSLPAGEENLVVKAAALLGVTAKIKLNKKIPTGGGLAGGSSDAARVLGGLNHLCGKGLTATALDELALKLGSDVPFFLHGASSVCSGRGEIVRAISRPTPKWALLIFPGFPMPTAAVYKRFDELKLGRATNIQETVEWNNWTRLPARELLGRLVNDLETPAFDLNPKLKELHEKWERVLGRTVRMSGSGSTLFTLFDEKPDADGAAALSVSGTHSAAVQLAPKFADDLASLKSLSSA